MILHITTPVDWDKTEKEGEYTATSLQTEGFTHCSTPQQAAGTANIFFKGQTGLVLLCIDENKLQSPCKYEPPTGGGNHNPEDGKLFPHIYGPVNLSAVIKVVDFSAGEDGTFVLPKEIA